MLILHFNFGSMHILLLKKCDTLENEAEFNVEYIDYFENVFEDHLIFRLIATSIIFNRSTSSNKCLFLENIFYYVSMTIMTYSFPSSTVI